MLFPCCVPRKEVPPKDAGANLEGSLEPVVRPCQPVERMSLPLPSTSKNTGKSHAPLPRLDGDTKVDICSFRYKERLTTFHGCLETPAGDLLLPFRNLFEMVEDHPGQSFGFPWFLVLLW